MKSYSAIISFFILLVIGGYGLLILTIATMLAMSTTMAMSITIMPTITTEFVLTEFKQIVDGIYKV